MDSNVKDNHSLGAVRGPGQSLPLAATLDFILQAGKLLFANGQTTEKIVVALTELATASGFKATLFVEWGALRVHLQDGFGSHSETISVEPAGVDMTKVRTTMELIQQVGEATKDLAAARSALQRISACPPVSLMRFALLAAAGAAALGVIFGVDHPVTLILIALIAGAGACLRRWLATLGHNLFIQPFGAALSAGIAGAIAVRLNLSSDQSLIAVFPCMILVPGPHFLNGALDLARARIPLGISRTVYATVVTLTISTGLVLGLAFGGAGLSPGGTSAVVPLGYDVLAAGVAVAAYGTFFNMSWSRLPIPIAVGMFAHGCRWSAITLAGVNPATGALIACLIVGIIMTPVADRLRSPFAGIAFASVVSLIPGSYLFRMAGGMASLLAAGTKASPELFFQVMSDATGAILIVVAMTFGLVVPKIGWPMVFRKKDTEAA
ncbi:MAG: threonine/serine exporter family protein [Verrucomicrobia bacterium]|nr:threonine/serine exporter family protein [Verrucomicrobiota bacterium]MBV8481952.1 threonine/serine exporter family protein [Verrucomicrobiota bacterium]